jgi:hypothetical protein
MKSSFLAFVASNAAGFVYGKVTWPTFTLPEDRDRAGSDFLGELYFNSFYTSEDDRARSDARGRCGQARRCKLASSIAGDMFLANGYEVIVRV